MSLIQEQIVWIRFKNEMHANLKRGSTVLSHKFAPKMHKTSFSCLKQERKKERFFFSFDTSVRSL